MAETALSDVSHLRAGPLRLLPDDRLARSAARGETRAFAAIFQRYHQELYRYCRAILRDAGEAEDALQNTMIRVLGALPGEEREIALRPWLYRVAHNEAISLLRQREPVAEPEHELTVAGPEHHSETSERLRGLVSDLEALPERQRSALVMRELSGIDYAEIGAALGSSSAGAKQVVYEARVALKEMAEGRVTACSEVQRELSAADGRVLRGRKLRAHVRGCAGCQDFRAGIGQRRADLAALAPPIPAAAAAGLLHSILGAGHGGGGGGGLLGLLAGGGGKTVATSAAVKSAAAVIATATIAVGTADLTGVINTPLTPGGSGSQTGASEQRAAGGSEIGTASGSTSTTPGQRFSATKHPDGKGSNASASGRSVAFEQRGGPPGHPVPGYGQQVAATHGPGNLPAAAQAHPTSTSHPGASASRAKPAARASGVVQAPTAHTPKAKAGLLESERASGRKVPQPSNG
jgi:RNA polymerase sigma factor (sigma-70 family)